MLAAPVAQLEEFLGTGIDAEILPRANVAPTLDVPALIQGDNGPQVRLLRWGLIPYWSKDPGISGKLVNARSETLLEKPAFREAAKRRRCVIPANGFYEWREEPMEASFDFGFLPPKKGKTYKQPFFFHRADGDLMGMAGIWERWKRPDGTTLETCAILTTTPNHVLEPFHDRMPCILEKNEFDLWISDAEKVESLLPLLVPLPDEALTFEPADPRINNVRYEPYAA